MQSAGGLFLQFVRDGIAGGALEAGKHCEALFVEVAGEGATDAGVAARYQDCFSCCRHLESRDTALHDVAEMNHFLHIKIYFGSALKREEHQWQKIELLKIQMHNLESEKF